MYIVKKKRGFIEHINWPLSGRLTAEASFDKLTLTMQDSRAEEQ